MVSGGNQPVFKGFYGNPGVKSFLPLAKTPDLYAYIQQRKCLNEHTNGLVRQYFPKATDFHEVLGEDVRRVEELLNGRPRKVLNYRTPAEVFNEASCKRKQK